MNDQAIQPRTRYAIGGFLIALTTALRVISYPIVSGDYTSSLTHWMDALKGSPGLTAFTHTFSDYPPLYLYILKIISLLPGYDLYWIKSLSVLFDVILASVIVAILRHIFGASCTRDRSFLAFAIVLVIPTIFINSSLWGQCDVIYSTFIVLSLYGILRDRPFTASLMFAVAISLKLQAIFFFPVFLGYILIKNRGWAYILLIPAVYIITLVPAMFGGGSFAALFFTYIRQASEFSQLSLSSPSLFALINESSLPHSIYLVLLVLGYILAFASALFVVRTVYRSLYTERNKRTLLFISLVSVTSLPFFLPHMHDRYFYLADVMSVIYALSSPRRWYVPLIIVGASFFSYMPFLSGQVVLFSKLMIPLSICAVCIALLLVSFTPRLKRLSLSAPHSRL